MMNIPLMRPDLRSEDLQALTEVLKSGMLIQGCSVIEMESDCVELMKVEHALAVSSGTAALHLALMALDIGPGDEVIVPALSYVATANVVEVVGATTVFVDVESTTFNIDVNQIEAAITEKTKAIIAVHEFGLACELDQLRDLCDDHQLYLIEDAACAMGATINNKHVGGTGDVACFSLHPRKAITTGEGGILTTNSPQLADRLRRLRNHGIELENGQMNFVEAGLNYRLTDFQAALFNSQLKRFGKQLERKREIAKVYQSGITNPLFTLPTVPEHCEHSWQTYHVLLDEKVDRKDLIAHLAAAGIFTNYGAQCIPAQTYFLNKYKYDAPKAFPNAYRAFVAGLAIPLYNLLTDNEVNYIVKTVNQYK